LSTASVTKTFPEKWRRGFLDIPYFAHEVLEMNTHAGQDIALNGMRLKRNSFICAGNRFGKGEIGLIYGCWMAAYKPCEKQFKHKNMSILNTSITQDQSNIIFDKFRDSVVNKKNFSWLVKDIKLSPFPHIEFTNGVIWWFRNAAYDGKFLEGRSYLYTNTDELDLFADAQRFQEEMLEPRTWDYAGFMSVMTTPRRGKKNAFKLWTLMQNKIKEGDEDYFTYQGDSRMNKFLSPATIVHMNSLPPRLFAKNVKGEWEAEGNLISSEFLDAAQLKACGLQDVPRSGKTHINAWDLARARTWCTRVTLEVGDILQIVSVDRFKDQSETVTEGYWRMVEQKIKAAHHQWPGTTAFDRTGIGDVLFSYIAEIAPVPIVLSHAMEEDLIRNGAAEFQHGRIGLPFIERRMEDGSLWIAQDELRDFEPDIRKSILWDFVCALFIAIAVARGKFTNQTETSNPLIPRVRGVKKNVAIR